MANDYNNGYNPNGYNQQQPPYQQPYQQQPVYQQNIYQQRQSNGVGTAGFVLAILALVLCWVPVLDGILWLVGAILSIIGCFKAPRGLAIAGTVISFIGVIILLAFFGALLGLAAL